MKKSITERLLNCSSEELARTAETCRKINNVTAEEYIKERFKGNTDMYDYDEGLDKDGFCERINDYVYDNHIDKTTDDVSKEWKLSLPELTKKIAKEDFKIEL